MIVKLRWYLEENKLTKMDKHIMKKTYKIYGFEWMYFVSFNMIELLFQQGRIPEDNWREKRVSGWIYFDLKFSKFSHTLKISSKSAILYSKVVDVYKSYKISNMFVDLTKREGWEKENSDRHYILYEHWSFRSSSTDMIHYISLLSSKKIFQSLDNIAWKYLKSPSLSSILLIYNHTFV